MIAWHVFEGEAWEASMLIFAPTSTRARSLASKHGTWFDFEEYIYIRARRAKQWDHLFDCEKVIDTNEELPAGAPPFYGDEAI